MNTYIVKVTLTDGMKEQYAAMQKRLAEKKEKQAKAQHWQERVKQLTSTKFSPDRTYLNLSKRSGVKKYRVGKLPNGDDYIWIWFTSGHLYKYSTSSCGAYHMDKLMRNAARGWWLNRYLNKYRPPYYWKGLA